MSKKSLQVHTAASVNVGMNLLKHTPERDLMLANVEALTQDELGPDCFGSNERGLCYVSSYGVPAYYCCFVCASAVSGIDPDAIAAEYYSHFNLPGGTGVRPSHMAWFAESNFPPATPGVPTPCEALSTLILGSGLVCSRVINDTMGHVFLIHGANSVSPELISLKIFDTALDPWDGWYDFNMIDIIGVFHRPTLTFN